MADEWNRPCKRATTCVVLVGQPEPSPKPLLAGLHRRGVRTAVVPDAPGVMVTLAGCPTNALIVLEPNSVPHLYELLAAVNRCYPKTVCWKYRVDRAGQGPQLTKLNVQELHKPVETIEVTSGEGVDDVAEPPTATTLHEPIKEPEVLETLLITQEEIAMLIGPGEDYCRPGHPLATGPDRNLADPPLRGDFRAPVRERAPMTSADAANANSGAIPFPASTRSSRSALVVGRGPTLDDLVEHVMPEAGFTQPIQRVEGYLFAMGQIRHTGAPDLVIGRCDTLDGSATSIAEALRYLAPRSRLLLVTDTNDHPVATQMVRAGFDTIVVDPVSPAALAAACGVIDAPQGAPLAHTTNRTIADQVRSRLLTQVAGAARVERPTFSGDQLGDVDLIEQLLHDPNKVHDIALKIIHARSGIRELGLVVNAEHVPSGHDYAAVSDANHTYGHLHAMAPVSTSRLQAWAQWLASWAGLVSHVTGLWKLAVRDQPMGLWSRQYFDCFLKTVLELAARERFGVSLMILELDTPDANRFEQADSGGILHEIGRLVQAHVRAYDVVARIADSQIGVIIWDAEPPRRSNSQHPSDVQHMAQRFRSAIEQQLAARSGNDTGTLTLFGGLASFPWGGRTPRELLVRIGQTIQHDRKMRSAVMTIG